MPRSPRIIGYSYEADIYCPRCTQFRFFDPSVPTDKRDEHLVPLEAKDREGNRVHPIFSTDEPPEHTCWCRNCNIHVYGYGPDLEAFDKAIGVVRKTR